MSKKLSPVCKMGEPGSHYGGGGRAARGKRGALLSQVLSRYAATLADSDPDSRTLSCAVLQEAVPDGLAVGQRGAHLVRGAGGIGLGDTPAPQAPAADEEGVGTESGVPSSPSLPMPVTPIKRAGVLSPGFPEEGTAPERFRGEGWWPEGCTPATHLPSPRPSLLASAPQRGGTQKRPPSALGHQQGRRGGGTGLSPPGVTLQGELEGGEIRGLTWEMRQL